MRFVKDNGLIWPVVLFFGSLVGMLLAGWQVEIQELLQHDQAPISIAAYFFGHAFQSALCENWESEFLQLSAYVMMTAILFQRGSSESKDPDQKTAAEGEDPAKNGVTRTPCLCARVALLFLGSFVLHWLHSVGRTDSTPFAGPTVAAPARSLPGARSPSQFPHPAGVFAFWRREIEGALHSVSIPQQRLIKPSEFQAVGGAISIQFPHPC